jgi:hypothetical protein
LSQFVEWGQARQQATEYQTNDMPEEQLLNFLKDARLVVTQVNHFILSEKVTGFTSKGHTQDLIDKITEENVNTES